MMRKETRTNPPVFMHKREIVRILREIAFFLRLRGENPYKARAYEQAGAAPDVVPLWRRQRPQPVLAARRGDDL